MTPEDRPWYGSSRKGEYRLLDTDLERDEDRLFTVCNDERSTKPAIETFRGFKYVDSGWEWSVFRHQHHVYKIPSGRFEEVSDPRYMLNTEINYLKILRYVDEKYVAETQFHAEFIEQQFIEARHTDTLDLRHVDHPTRKDLICMFSSLLILLQREDWLPDLDIEPRNGTIQMKNWLIDRSGIPKIIDFTSYYDVLRLSKRRLEIERAKQVQRLVDALRSLSSATIVAGLSQTALFEIMADTNITNLTKRPPLLELLVKIAIDQNRPISLVEFVGSAFEAGFRSDALCYPCLIMAGLKKLVIQGVFTKHDAQCTKMPDGTIVWSKAYYSLSSVDCETSTLA